MASKLRVNPRVWGTPPCNPDVRVESSPEVAKHVSFARALR